MKGRQHGRGDLSRRLIAVVLIFALLAGCPEVVPRVGIPLAYGLTGLCLALVVTPTPWGAVVGFVLGCTVGAMVYNNSLKHRLQETPPAPGGK
jgi:predicted PurR-regulated permease PerM